MPLTWWRKAPPYPSHARLLDGRDTDVLYGPDGWLDPYSGGWAAATVQGAAITLAPIASPPPVEARQASALRAGFAMAAEPREIVWFTSEGEVYD